MAQTSLQYEENSICRYGDITIAYVRDEDVRSFWPLVRPLLLPAIRYGHGKYRIEDVFKQLTAKTAMLWVAQRGEKIIFAMVTKVNLYPQSKTLTVFIGGGDLDGMLALREEVEDYSLQIGCDAIECHGRPGWVRVMKQFGYTDTSMIVRKSLEAQDGRRPGTNRK